MALEHQLNPPAIYGEAVAGRAATVRKDLQALTAKMQRDTFDLADLLFEVQEKDYHLQWGFENIYEYATTELGVKERRVQYLTRIVKVCREVGMSRKNYEPAGISKLREISTLNPTDFFYDKVKEQNFPLTELIVDLILDAPDMTLQQVSDQVDLWKGQTGENKQVVRNFGCTQSCWDHTIKPALELAAKKLGSAGRDVSGQAVEYSEGAKWEIICASYLQDPNNYEDEPDESGEQVDNEHQRDEHSVIQGSETNPTI
jgi:hypothetical protein